jgi:transcription elongation GreA/GreB family factor
MDKKELIDQLVRQLEASARAALASRDAAAAEARDGATPDEKREDARAAHQLASLGRAQQQRARQALAEVDGLAQFRPPPLPATAAIGVGAIVEVEDADSGEGRTFFLAPVGAGITLTGPGGDGHLSVVTPASPIGRAVLGRRTGDVVDITVDGDLREWAITYVGLRDRRSPAAISRRVLDVDERVERGQLAAVEEQPLAALAPVVLDVPGAAQRDHIARALVAPRDRRSRAVMRVIGRHPGLDHVCEPERIDHVALALVQHDAAAPGAAIDLDRLERELRHLACTAGTLHRADTTSARATTATPASTRHHALGGRVVGG